MKVRMMQHAINDLKNYSPNTSLLSLASLLVTSILLGACATPVGEVASWPVTNAEQSELTGTVVDVLCELNGNCADNCGDGKRQLAIKTKNSGTESRTILVSKNLTNYTGAVVELSPYCNQVVDLNGLFTEHSGVRFFQVQNVRPSGGQWRKATGYLQAWSERTGKPLSQANNWQDNDERVQEIIERDGVLGLGLEADQEYLGQ